MRHDGDNLVAPMSEATSGMVTLLGFRARNSSERNSGAIVATRFQHFHPYLLSKCGFSDTCTRYEARAIVP